MVSDMPFIYVCTPQDRDRLMALGYQLLAANDETSLWVFKDDETIDADLAVELGTYVFSNTLMF